MIKNIFVSYFVIAAFIYMTVSAWTQVITVGGNMIGGEDTTTSKTELVFLFGVVVFITTTALLGVWYMSKKSTPVDEEKVEEIEEALEYMEMLD